MRNQILQELRLAVPGAADDVGVLEAGREREEEGQPGLEEGSKGRAGEIDGDQLGRAFAGGPGR